MRNPDQPANVADDILQRQRSNLTFAIQMRSHLRTPILVRHLGQIILVPQQVIDDQDPCLFDLFLDRFETTKITLVEREGRVLGRVEVLHFVGLNLLGLLDHLWVSAKTLSAELINSRYSLWDLNHSITSESTLMRTGTLPSGTRSLALEKKDSSNGGISEVSTSSADI